MAFSMHDPIDEDGYLSVRIGGGWEGAPFSLQENNRLLALSSYLLFLEVDEAGLRKPLLIDALNPHLKLLPPLTQAECAALATGHHWAIWDETGGKRIFLCGGKVRTYK
jgi:hypothetical protein